MDDPNFICNLTDPTTPLDPKNPNGIFQNWNKPDFDVFNEAQLALRLMLGANIGSGISVGPWPPTHIPIYPDPDWFYIPDNIKLRRRCLRIKRIVLAPFQDNDQDAIAAHSNVSRIAISPDGFKEVPVEGNVPERIKMCGVIYTLRGRPGIVESFPRGDLKALPLEVEINGYIYSRAP